jgi:hypothetical protein
MPARIRRVASATLTVVALAWLAGVLFNLVWFAYHAVTG